MACSPKQNPGGALPPPGHSESSHPSGSSGNRGQGRSYLIILASALLLLWYVVAKDGPDRLLAALYAANLWWMGGSVLCMMAYWLLESLSLHLVARQLHPAQRFADTLTTSMIGQLFNCITPFASGGQPVQAYHMLRRGMPLGAASSALLAKFIIYQSVLTFYSLAVLFFKFRFFTLWVTGFGPLVLVGFGVNTLVVAGLVAVGFFPRFSRTLLGWGARLLARFGLMRDLERSLRRIETEVEGFYQGFLLLRSHPVLLLGMSLLTVLQLTAFFAVPYTVRQALGSPEAVVGDLFTIIAAGAFVLMVSSFVPLPGAAGGAEGSFYLFFGMFFPHGLLGLATIAWRLVTFYLPIFVGLWFTRGLTTPEAQTGLPPPKVENLL